ncbi:RICIN domain-containing protein [Sorangium sp. So ce693]|uniref:RICIN domain-containing protein n=1 Tax=Sorangium sp. So ce693 TaxID=3133318 RepID=UPI003F63C4C2
MSCLDRVVAPRRAWRCTHPRPPGSVRRSWRGAAGCGRGSRRARRLECRRFPGNPGVGVDRELGAFIVLLTCNGNPGQQWSVTDLGGGAVRITSRLSGKVIDAHGSPPTDRTALFQTASSGGSSQLFTLNPVGTGADAGAGTTGEPEP